MNKNTFIAELSRKLRRLPKDDFDDAMIYYVEYFAEAGIDEDQDVIPMVGTVDEVASKILDEYSEKQIEKAETEGGAKNHTRAVWYVILGIFAAPIAFPIAIAIVAVLFSIMVAVIAVIFSMLVAGVSVVAAGFGAIFAAFWAENVAQILFILGCGLVCVSLGVMIVLGFYKLGELFIRGIIKLFRSIGKKNKSKEGGAQ